MFEKNQRILFLATLAILFFSLALVTAEDYSTSDSSFSSFGGIGIIIFVWMLISISKSDKESMKETGNSIGVQDAIDRSNWLEAVEKLMKKK